MKEGQSKKGRKWRKSEEQGVEEDLKRKWKGAWECKRKEKNCLRIVIWNCFRFDYEYRFEKGCFLLDFDLKLLKREIYYILFFSLFLL